ncbi:MAG: anthranilate phosphoribosyltransferase [Bacteroidota bacterium]
MKFILKQLFEHRPLEYDQAKDVMFRMSEGAYNDHELSSFMTVYLMRSITIEELLGFREALLSLALPLDIQQENLLDIVGTGGDGKNTFNISTLACFVAAGAGLKIAKHGNYGASSISGASNVMEQLGYHFTNDQAILNKQVEEVGICFMHAPLFHPALKIVGPIRKNLSIRTFFNLMGPVVNPAAPSAQLLGVSNLEMARIYTYLLQKTSQKFTIIHSLDGYDEISLTHDTKIITQNGEQIKTPESLSGLKVKADHLAGGNTKEEAAKIFIHILEGNGTEAQEKVVLANAAMGLQCAGSYSNYEEAFAAAEESLKSKKAFQCLKKLIATQ